MIKVSIILACRLWVHNDEPNEANFTTKMLRVASAARAQYVTLMNQSGMHPEKQSVLNSPCVHRVSWLGMLYLVLTPIVCTMGSALPA